MIIIGVDFHPEFQQIALVDTDSGELEERRLHHPEEAAGFYRALVSDVTPTTRAVPKPRTIPTVARFPITRERQSRPTSSLWHALSIVADGES
jgi:hypothetical protein